MKRFFLASTAILLATAFISPSLFAGLQYGQKCVPAVFGVPQFGGCELGDCVPLAQGPGDPPACGGTAAAVLVTPAKCTGSSSYGVCIISGGFLNVPNFSSYCDEEGGECLGCQTDVLITGPVQVAAMLCSPDNQ